MGKVTLNMSMSLDGFIAGPNVSVDLPMGEGGLRLHDWLFNSSASEVDAEVEQELFATTGAVVLGRRTFDVGVHEWGDTPFPVPCFVLTHKPREALVKKSGTFTFVTDGIESALQQAKAVAGEKNISLMGADIAQQFLKAGLLDEIQINLVPVLLGDGIRLFDHLGAEPIELEKTQVINSLGVTHVRFRIVKKDTSMKSHQLTHAPVAKAEMLIRKPVAEVFEAFINPAITSKFWFTKSSGRLEPDKQIQWDWEMYNASAQVRVKAIEQNKRILIEWSAYDPPTTVEWIFTPRADNTTFVSVTNSGLSGNGDEIVKQVIDSTEGFTLVLSGLKALLEHNIILNLVADRFPEGLENTN